MRNILLIEMKKSLKHRLFIIVLIIATALAIYSGLEGIRRYQINQDLWLSSQQASGIVRNPDHSLITLFNTWLGEDYNSLGTALFYLLLPLLAAMTYGWSFLSESLSGYNRQIISRTKRWKYVLAKYIATFTSGALVILIPLLINFMFVSSFIPASRPLYVYDAYYAQPSLAMGSDIFYQAPYLFILIRLLLAFFLAGLCSVSCIALSFVNNNRYVVVMAPFLALLTVNYFSEALLSHIGYIELSPLRFIHGGNLNATKFWVVFLWLACLFVFSFGITIWRGINRDVY